MSSSFIKPFKKLKAIMETRKQNNYFTFLSLARLYSVTYTHIVLQPLSRVLTQPYINLRLDHTPFERIDMDHFWLFS